MPQQTIDEEISQAKHILENWKQYKPQIEQVRKLEMQTMMTPVIDRARGYYRMDALQGYQQIINAYELIGNVTPQQSEGLAKVSGVLEGLKDDQKLVGDHPTPDAVKRYSALKMQQLEQNGEVYLLSGHEEHFNITKIKKQPDGSYSYTLYDAGHESKVLRYENGRPVINAVQENAIRPGTDIRNLIETDVIKKAANSDGAAYKEAKKTITNSLIDPPIRAEVDWGQRKGNCTTRGQRILASDILQDPALSEGLYDFASNVQGTSTDEIRQSLETRVKYLEGIKQGAIQNAGSKAFETEVENFIKAGKPENFENMNIPLDGGGRMDAYRTKPGVFSREELDTLHGTLERNGLRSSIRESTNSPGQFYLYVPNESGPEVHNALGRDKSPAADMFRKYGDQTPQHIAQIIESTKVDPLDVISDQNKWQSSTTNDGKTITRVAIGGMRAEDVAALEARLREKGFTPYKAESSTLGPTIRLVGDDVAKLHGLQADLARPLSERVMEMGVWKEASKDGGGFMTRMETKGMTPEQVAERMQQLTDAGFKPALRESATLGQTIRLSGEDALKVHTMRKEMIAQAGWQDALVGVDPITRVGIDGKTPAQVAALTNALKAEGIEPIAHRSVSMGETLRVKGDGLARLKTIQTNYGSTTPQSQTPVANAPVLNAPPVQAPVIETPPVQAPVVNAPPVQGQGAVPKTPLVPEPVVNATPAPQPVVNTPPAETPPVNGSKSQFIQGSAAAVAVESLPSVRQRGMGGAGAGAIGLVMSAQGLKQAVQTGDKVEAGIAGVNLVTSTAQTTESVLAATGKSLPLLGKAGKFIPGVNVAATVADGVYQISKEDTTQHKVERGVAVTATATTGLVLGTAAATAGETAAIAGVVGVGGAAVVVAAAPVVLTVAAVGAVAYTGEKVIEAKRAWDDVDNMIAENAKPVRRNVKLNNDDGKPSILQYRHLAVEMIRVSKDMKDENMSGKHGRDQNGRILLDEVRRMDMRDPKNIAEYERVLDDHIAKEAKIIKDNDSVLPKWLRFSDSLSKFTDAQLEQADLTAAKAELQMYKKELKDYDAAHPDSPATTGAAKNAVKPKATKGPGAG